MGVIYKITSPTGRLYIGKTYNLKQRLKAHKHAAKRGRNFIVSNSFNKYGFENHIVEIIEEVEDSLMDEREMYWIAELKTYCYDNPNGMNMTKGGDGQRSTWMHKIELREYFSKLFSGEGGPFYGKKHTEEAKKIIAEKASKRNKEKGITIPKWGAEKGRLKVVKPVLIYDSNGNFVREFESCVDCANFLKVDHSTINGVLSNKKKSSKGYFIKYKTENYPLKIEDKLSNRINKNRRIICYFRNDKFEFENAKEASEKLGIPKTTINRAAYYNNGKAIRTGHVFEYAD